MKQVYIRVDGNEIIATGHVMRCLSIAEQIRKLGIEVIFVTADDRPCSLIESRGFKIDILGTMWNDLDRETQILCSYVKQHKVQVILVDSYFVTKDYLQNLLQYTTIIYIDDLYRFAYPVHTLIHYGAFTDIGRYIDLYESTQERPGFLIGGRYVPLRDEFAGQTFTVRPQIGRVLITTGGTDQLNVAGSLLKSVMQNEALKELEYHVIIGCFNKNKDMLYALAEKYPRHIDLHEDVKNMAEWMRHCDVAISAAGTTTYELCACGIPSICLEVADNQKGAKVWEENGYMLYAGNAGKNKAECIRRCEEALLWYQTHYEARADMSVRMQSLIDGYGAKRIAEYIDNYMRSDRSAESII